MPMRIKAVFFTLFLLRFCLADAGDVDPGKSRIDVVSRAGENNCPILNEPLAIRITLKDNEGNPLAGINGNEISVFIETNGNMSEKTLSGKSGSDGIIYASFTPENITTGNTIKFAARINDIVIQRIATAKYSIAAEAVGPAQVLWNGCNPIFGKKTAGQTFVCGNISEISRIKVMLAKNSDSANIGFPVLNIYEWKNDYKSTIAAPALAAASSQGFDEGHYFGKNLAVYQVKCPVKSGTKYYFELSFPDNSGDENNFIKVYRTWNTDGGITPFCPDSYPDGATFLNGQETTKSDLMFYVFCKKDEVKTNHEK